MSSFAMSALSLGASQYDFSSMTNTQDIAAAANLANEGDITGDQFAIMAGEALSFSPGGSIQAGSSSDPLTSTTDQNFVKMLQENITDLQSVAGGDTAEQKSLTTETALMQELNSYGMTGTTESNGALINQNA
jgi:azurin